MVKQILFLVMACIVSFSVRAETIKVAAGEIPHVFHPETPGPYNRVFELLNHELSGAMHLNYYPLNRAMQRIASMDYDCFAMALKNSPNLKKAGIDSSQFRFIGPIQTLQIKVYARPEDRIRSFDDLAGSLVMADATIINLRDQFDDLPKSVTVASTKDYITALKFVAAGRSKAALAYDVDINVLRSEADYVALEDTGLVLASYEDGMICKDTERLAPSIDRMQARLDQLRESGTLEEVFAGR